MDRVGGCEEACDGADDEEVEVSVILMASKEVVLSEMPKRRSVSAICAQEINIGMLLLF